MVVVLRPFVVPKNVVLMGVGLRGLFRSLVR